MITLTAADIATITDRLEDAGALDDGNDIRTGYSGRGMFGDRCLGFVGHDCTRFAFELAVVRARGVLGFDDDEDPSVDAVRAALDDIGEPVTDSMGTQAVFYWPNITVEPSDEDAEARA
jgi:hypothetical protein